MTLWHVDLRQNPKSRTLTLDSAERDDWLNVSDRTDLGAACRVRHHEVARFGMGDEGKALIEPISQISI